MSSKACFIHSLFHAFLRKTTREWMDWIEYPYPTTPFPCIPEMVGTDGNDWEWIEALAVQKPL